MVLNINRGISMLLWFYLPRLSYVCSRMCWSQYINDPRYYLCCVVNMNTYVLNVGNQSYFLLQKYLVCVTCMFFCHTRNLSIILWAIKVPTSRKIVKNCANKFRRYSFCTQYNYGVGMNDEAANGRNVP